MRPGFWITVLCLFTLAAPAQAERTSGALFIQSAHTDGIWALAFSPSGKLLASSSEDGMVRLWDVDSARALRVFSAPDVARIVWIDEGKLVLISQGMAVIVDATTGKELGVVGASLDQVHVAQVEGETRLIGTSGLVGAPSFYGLDGLRLGYVLINEAVLEERGKKKEEAEPEITSPEVPSALVHCMLLTASAQGHLAVSCSGKEIAVFRADARGQNPKLLWHTKLDGSFDYRSASFWGARLSPDGRHLDVLGSRSWHRVSATGTKTTALPVHFRSPRISETGDIAFDVSDSEGLKVYDLKTKRLVLAERWAKESHPCGGGEQVQAYQVASISPDGKLLATGTSGGEVRLWDARSGRAFSSLGKRIRVPERLVFQKDATLVAHSACGAATWSLTTGERVSFSPRRAVYKRDDEALLLLNQRNRWRSRDRDPDPVAHQLIRTATTALETEERTYVGTSTGSLVVLEGEEQKALHAGDGVGFVTLAHSKKLGLVAAVAKDGAITVFDDRTAKVRVTLLDFADGEFLAMSPGGAFSGTPEAGDRVGWVYDAPTEFFGFARFAGTFQRLDVVSAHLKTGASDLSVQVKRPPSLEVTKSEVVAGNMARLSYVTSAEGGVRSVSAFVGGRLVATGTPEQGESGLLSGTLEVPLLSGSNHVSLVAQDNAGASSNSTTVVASGAREGRPDLFVVTVGVSSYPHLVSQLSVTEKERKRLHDKVQLPAASGDARATASRLSGQKTYATVHSEILLDDAATPQAIDAALKKLSAMRPDDVAVVSFAGHGFPTASGEMVFATGGAILKPDGSGLAEASLKDSALGWKSISGALAGAKGKVILLLDACHSGSFQRELLTPNDLLAAQLASDGRAGVTVFAASKGRQFSLEPKNARALVLSDEVASSASPEILVAGAQLSGFTALTTSGDPTGSATRAADSDAATSASSASRSKVMSRRRGQEGEESTANRGYFTGAFLDVLADPGADRNGDRALSLREIVEEVTTRVSRRSRGLQTPWLVRSESVGDFNLFGVQERVAFASAHTSGESKLAALRVASQSAEATAAKGPEEREPFLPKGDRDASTSLPERTWSCVDSSPEVQALEQKCDQFTEEYRRLEQAEAARLKEACAKNQAEAYVCQALGEGRVSSELLADFRDQAEDFCRDSYYRLSFEVVGPRCAEAAGP